MIPQVFRSGQIELRGDSLVPLAVRILVVDDSEPWRGFVCSNLRGKPEFQVVGEASDGWQAAQLAQELQPDLILLDIAIPALNGIEAAKQIRRAAPKSNILFLSGIASLDIAEAALQTGALGYVVKLDAASELLPAIKTVLEGKTFIGRGIQRLFREDSSSPVRKGTSFRQPKHVVQFYADDADLVSDLHVLVRDTLDAGAAAIGILTDAHWMHLQKELNLDGVNLQAAIDRGRFIAFNAMETLGALIDANGLKCESVRLQFEEMIRRSQSSAISKDVPVVIFGEMVGLLCTQGEYEAAIQLEKLADELASIHSLYMCCFYPASQFEKEPGGGFYAAICAEHREVVSAF